jgi:hypothetical protein
MATKRNSIALSKARDDEPIFVLRGQDRLAPDVVRQWADRAEQAGCDTEKVREAREVAAAMEAWPQRKLPD